MSNNNGKVVINLATRLKDPECVTVAFLVATAAAQAGKQVTMCLTEETVRLPGVVQGIARDGCPAVPATTVSPTMLKLSRPGRLLLRRQLSALGLAAALGCKQPPRSVATARAAEATGAEDRVAGRRAYTM